MAPSPEDRPFKRGRSLHCSHEAATSCCTPAPAEGGATAAAVTLPNDLIFDVLSRVPLRSVCRFRCVSRGWRALISDSAFIAAHKSLHAEPVVVVSSGNPYKSRDLRMMDMEGNVVMVLKNVHGFGVLSTSQDNLICTTDYRPGADQNVSVIDPAARKVLANVRGVLPFRLSNLFGFGCAIPSNVHKVVRLSIDQQAWRCDVLTLGGGCRGSCRRSETPQAPVSEITSSVTVNGVVYFLVAETLSDATLLPFDLNAEKWKKMIERPGKSEAFMLWRRTVMTRIAELNGALCMVQSKIYKQQCTDTIWLLTNQDVWIKAYTIPTNACTPLRVTHDGGKLIFHCILREEGSVVRVYDPHTETCTTLWKLDASQDRIAGLCSLSLDRFVLTNI